MSEQEDQKKSVQPLSQRPQCYLNKREWVYATNHPAWSGTALDISGDPQVCVKFYQDNFAMTLVDVTDVYGDGSLVEYCLATLTRDEQKAFHLTPGTREAHAWTWEFRRPLLRLVADQMKAEMSPEEKGDLGASSNGFGHIAFNCNDVYVNFEQLTANGVTYKKGPDDGRMKGIAFMYDPMGYWIELISRGPDHTLDCEYNLSQTMLRVKDPKLSLKFYQEVFDMTLVRETHFDSFSLYFLCQLNNTQRAALDFTPENGREFMKNLFVPVLELTHNHGTEDKDGPAYVTGEAVNFGMQYLSFSVDQSRSVYEQLKSDFGETRVGEPASGMTGEWFDVRDPDGYTVRVAGRSPSFC